MSAGRTRSHQRLALAGLLTAIFAVLMWNSRGQFLFADEWAFYVRAGDFGVDRAFESHLGNLHLFSNLLYAGFFDLFGVDRYLPFRLLWAGLTVLLGWLIYAFCRPRVGGWAALAPVALIGLFGAGWEVTGGPLGITLLACSCAGLGSILMLERRTLRGDALASLLLALALAIYSAGIAWGAGVAVDLLLRGRAGLRRAWVVLAPAVLYAAWRVYELRFDETNTSLSNVLSLPASMASSLASLSASLAGTFRGPDSVLQISVDPATGWVLAALVVAAVVARFAVAGRWPLDRRVWVFIAMPLAFWAAIGAEAGAPQAPTAGRYQFIGAIFAVLLASQLLAGRRIGRTWAIALVVVIAAGFAANVANLRDAGRFLRENGEQNRAQLAGLELVREGVPGFAGIELITRTPGLPEDMLIVADAYFQSVDTIGSPAYALERIPGLRESVRERVDSQMVASLFLRARPTSEIPAPPSGSSGAVSLDGAVGGEARQSKSCVGFRPQLDGAIVTAALPKGGFRIDQANDAAGAPPAVTALRLRRFGDRFVTGLPAPGLEPTPELRDQVVTIVPDSSPVPWHVEVTAAAPLRICPV